jgi:cytochrome c oxidase subunit II
LPNAPLLTYRMTAKIKPAAAREGSAPVGDKRRAVDIMGLSALLLLAACEGEASTLDSRGIGAARIEGLWWLVFWIATVFFLVVVAFLVAAILRSRRQDVEIKKDVRWGAPFIVVSGVIVPAIVLVAVFALSLRDSQELSNTGAEATLEIEIRAHDWWWEVRYPNGAVTANEIHIPVGEPVKLRLLSADVVHSFWVPRLQGKTDNITGRVTNSWLQAEEPGRYRGQCAEFCGLQHANMRFFVVAEPREQFDAWLENEASPAAEGTAVAGEDVFLSSTCVGCHAIRGTPANSQIGPDLTHVADRRTLFGGTVPNTPEYLERIIIDPQSIKPGVPMPPTDLSSQELQALVEYLRQLD